MVESAARPRSLEFPSFNNAGKRKVIRRAARQKCYIVRQRTERACTLCCYTGLVFTIQRPSTPSLCQFPPATCHPRRPFDGIWRRALLVNDARKARQSPIGFRNYQVAGDEVNGRWIEVDLAWNHADDARSGNRFLQLEPPIGKSQDFGGEDVWTNNRSQTDGERHA